jgi:hypothetical protein
LKTSGPGAADAFRPHCAPNTWLDVDGNPLPFQDEEEILEFLRTAEAATWQSVNEGINQIDRVVLERNGVRVHAAWRVVDLELDRFTLSNGSTLMKLRDQCLFEVAAYNLSRLLGLTNIPPTVQRKIPGQVVGLQIWVEGAVTYTDLKTKLGTPPKPIVWSYQNQTMALFDGLVFNVDRNQGNILIDKGWKLWMIDHTRAFQRSWEPWKLESIQYCDREVFNRLKGLDEELLRSELRDFLGLAEVADLLRRRDRIVAHIENLIAEKGEGAVLF